MRIAILGASPAAVALATEITVRDQVHIEGLFPDPRHNDSQTRQEISRLTGLAWEADWSELLNRDVDWVLVANPAREDLGAELLRRLVQAGLDLWLPHPACDSILAYELDMTLQEGRHQIQIAAGLAEHPVMEALRGVIADGEASPIGAIESIRMERTAPAEDEVSDHFARDARCLNRIAGDVHIVQGLGQPAAEGEPKRLIGAALTCGEDRVVQWSFASGDSASFELRVLGAKGRARAWGTVPTAQLEIESAEPHVSGPILLDAWSPAAAAVDDLIENPAERRQRQWRDALRCLEAAELARQSATRGRALPLQRDHVTEADAFKGVMAAWGCGLLMATLVVLLVFSMWEGLRFSEARARWEQEQRARETVGRTDAAPDPPQRWPLWLRLWPVYPLAIFLGLQVFRVICRSSPRQPVADKTSPPPDQ